MKDSWGKTYLYGRDSYSGTVAHIVDVRFSLGGDGLCGAWLNKMNCTPKPYPICRNCLRTKRAKELGLP